LNVFPVPDGDTGSNMLLTLDAVRNLQVKGNALDSYAETAAKAVMRSARGNSGVILSLFFRGMAATFSSHQEADSSLLLEAFRSGAKEARKAVLKPVEGTILTVMRDCADFELKKENQDIIETLDTVSSLALASLERTPELLPTLKKAKVVDSGGYGFTIVISGMLKALTNDKLEESKDTIEDEYGEKADFSIFDTEEIKYSFCTECLINHTGKISEEKINETRQFLDNIGDSVVFVSDDEIVKVHVHTNEPMSVLNKMLEFGVPQFIKVENMRQQHNALVTQSEQKQPNKKKLRDECGIIAVANGDGLSDLFMELGAEYVVSGGQSMNPSANDFIKAIETIGCQRVIILPNNPNIILAAKQAANLVENVTIDVLETKTIPQGISAIISFNPMADREKNLADMNSSKDYVLTYSITQAVKNADIDGVNVRKKQFIVLENNKLKCAKNSIEECISSISTFIGNREVVTMYYGKCIKEDEAQKHAQLLSSKLHVNQSVAIVYGRQPIYNYIISAE